MATTDKKKSVSVIIPTFNEEHSLYANMGEILAWLQKSATDYDVLLVDDGSADGTWAVCRKLVSEHPEIRALRFGRNFGKEAAILCGLSESSGDAAIVMDSDLEHPPRLLPEMIRLWLDEGWDVVEAEKISRGKEPFYRRWFSRIFYKVMRLLSGYDLHQSTDFKLLGRKAIDTYIDLPEKSRFFRGLVAWSGLRRVSVPFSVPKAAARGSRWSSINLMRLSLDAITSFSYIPLRMIIPIGAFTFFFSAVMTIQTLYKKLSGHAVEGFTTVIIITLFCASVIMLSLGIIGVYLSRIYEELKRRPSFIVADRAGKKKPERA